MATKYHIKLTEAEDALLARLDLRDELPREVDSHAVYQSNREPIVELLRLLSARVAIPEQRRRYFTDPAYQRGRTKGSYQDLFIRNGNAGVEIYEHAHFKKFMRFFLFGAALPDDVIASFEERAGRTEWLSGSDCINLAKHAITLSRRARLEKHSAAEEFFKLSLDMGISLSHAEQIRGIIKRARL